MYKSALAGLLIFAAVTVSQSTSKAEALEFTQSSNIKLTMSQPLAIATFPAQAEEIKQTPAEEVKPVVVVHVVEENDSLSKIANKHSTTWQRIFDKNISITNPDIITVGQELIIPTADETLASRELPAPLPEEQPAPPKQAATKATRARATARAASAPVGSSSGNLYTRGYCTWYVKNKRPDLPNNLGNADTWVSRAAAQGLPTGTTPRAGAVGQRGMHVVYVESVNADGSVNISEMNHKGLYVITHRTLPGDYFRYIY